MAIRFGSRNQSLYEPKAIGQLWQSIQNVVRWLWFQHHLDKSHLLVTGSGDHPSSGRHGSAAI
jgi:hypothetical protein